ncbi:exodeoxyribonuclease VII small subunit [Simiduia sp. 21SJ11W-1]|uniref:exodeoxyribonuclease VII small subunit n=1 Tax=Simiduia sp. 21SJ11W-1 TaxID=2909669 RepID=UPI0020A15CFC|nr:exodeoxyribonuclease VII small subunit [Simiduia sp. 21SJ11W-1]UTA47512.1 exodeoxyribonuclease VII small subunit [Simiduia sp. 21SJ11W-1]
MATRKKAQDFEQSLAALEALVARMEEGDLSLEESLKAFEEGVQLTRECQARLQAAEQRVNLLLEKNGELSLEPLDQPEQDA